MTRIAKNIGRDGFVWFLGTVVDNINDPNKLGRCRVRILNLHGDSNDVPDEDLPWCSAALPITSASLLGVGDSPTGISNNSLVTGFFLDGHESQIPIITHTIPKINGGDEDKHDVAGLARGSNTIKIEPIGPEPDSAYAAKYPHNKTITTKSGHAIEIDDTPDHERIRIFHKAGSYVEINEDGRLVIKSQDDSFRIVNGDETVYVVGTEKITANLVDLDTPTAIARGNFSVNTGATGSFTTPTGQIITVADGIIINIY